MTIDISTIPPSELFTLAEQLGRKSIFGPWEQSGESFCRREPNRRPEDSRVMLWREVGNRPDDRPDGWYFRFGFGVLCIPGVNSTNPIATADEAKRLMDADLLEVGAIVVDPVTEPKP